MNLNSENDESLIAQALERSDRDFAEGRFCSHADCLICRRYPDRPVWVFPEPISVYTDWERVRGIPI